MPIQLEFINFIVPRKRIEQKYPGGWEQCLSDHKDLIGGRVWYDDQLFRDGAMNPVDIDSLLEEWSHKGFTTHQEDDDPRWLDVCVVEAISGGATLPCDWIEVEGNQAFYKGCAKGELISRNSFI